MQTSQEYFTTMVYAKFGGQTECIMGNWKIENMTDFACSRTYFETEAQGNSEIFPIETNRQTTNRRLVS